MSVDLKIFDVEHGACALLTAANDAAIMIDCGHNASSGWRPGTYLREMLGRRHLEMLAVTNYDEDHASGARNLWENVSVGSLYRNGHVSGALLRAMKSADGMGSGIDHLSHAMDSYIGPAAQVVFEGVTEQTFCHPYSDFQDENNLSMITFFTCYGVGVMFTGDMEVAGFEKMLEVPSFVAALNKTRVYIASHHGRRSGCSPMVAEQLVNCNYVIISDKGYMYDTQETLPFYRSIAKGGPFRGDNRSVLTTRRDGRIGFQFRPDSSWNAY